MNIPVTTLIVLTPIVSGIGASYLYPSGTELGKNNPVRPPKWVFGVIWPILYLLIGISWSLLRNKQNENKKQTWIVDTLFILLNILLFAWLYAANKLKNYTYSYYIIVSIMTIANLIAILSFKIEEPYILLWIPFLIWITIASNLNYSIAYSATD